MQRLIQAISCIIKIPPKQGVPCFCFVRQPVRAALLAVEDGAPPVVQVRGQGPLGELCSSTATIGSTVCPSTSASLYLGRSTGFICGRFKQWERQTTTKSGRTGTRKRWIRDLHWAHHALHRTSRDAA